MIDVAVHGEELQRVFHYIQNLRRELEAALPRLEDEYGPDAEPVVLVRRALSL